MMEDLVVRQRPDRGVRVMSAYAVHLALLA